MWLLGFECHVHVCLIRHGLRVLSRCVGVEMGSCVGLDDFCSILLLGLSGVACLHDIADFFICESNVKVFCQVCGLFGWCFTSFTFGSSFTRLGLVACSWDQLEA